MQWRRGWLLVAFAGTLATSAAEAPIQFLGPNLVPNPGFEVDGKPNAYSPWLVGGLGKSAEADVDTKDALEGKCSMRLTTLESGTRLVLQSPQIPVSGDHTYLFSLAFRQEGFTTSKKGPLYCGVSGSPSLCWLDAQGHVIESSNNISQFSYAPSPWDMRDAFETAPAGARFARIEVSITNNSGKGANPLIPSTVWIDAVQLRAYSPPPTPSWATGKVEYVVDGDTPTSPALNWFATDPHVWHMIGGIWSRVVNDPQAERGVALESPLNAGEGIMAHGLYNSDLPDGMGVYRLQIRAKAPPKAGTVGYAIVNSEHSGTRLKLEVTGKNDNAGYQTLEGDFMLRDNGWWCVRLHTLGKESWRIDQVRIIPLLPLSDQQLLSVYPAGAREIPADLLPARYQTVSGGPRQPCRILLVAGLGYDWFQLSRAFKLLHRDSEIEVAWVKKELQTSVIDGLPKDAPSLFGNSLICLCDVPINAMPLAQKNAIREYVRRGGSLLILGGQQGYERGGWQGSLLEEVMPVEVAQTIAEDLIDLGPDGAQIKLTETDGDWPAFANQSMPYVRYLHKVALKPGAIVLAMAKEYPFIVAGRFGEGRVVCVLGRAEGRMSKAHLPFRQWQHWPLLLRDAQWRAEGYSEKEYKKDGKVPAF